MTSLAVGNNLYGRRKNSIISRVLRNSARVDYKAKLGTSYTLVMHLLLTSDFPKTIIVWKFVRRRAGGKLHPGLREDEKFERYL